MNPRLLLLIAAALLLLGWLLPAMMILQVIPSTFFLNFFAYAASFLGLILGFLGIALWLGRNRRR